MIDDDGFSPILDGLPGDETGHDLDPADGQDDDAELFDRDDVDFVRGDATPNDTAYILGGFELLNEGRHRGPGRAVEWLPSERQIRQMCSAIRSTWSDDMLRSRGGTGTRAGWQPPAAKMGMKLEQGT